MVGNYAFSGCKLIRTVDLSGNIKTIGREAFKDCAQITTLKLGANLELINSQAFQNCTNITQLHIWDVANWCSVSFQGDYACPLYTDTRTQTVKASLYIDGEYARSVVIPEGVTSIPRWAFSCVNIESLVIGESVVTINAYAFYGCRMLEELVIPDSVTTIGESAFRETGLVTADLSGASLTKIDVYAFAKCASLEKVWFGSALNTIAKGSFTGCSALSFAYFEATSGWNLAAQEGRVGISIDYNTLSSAENAAVYLINNTNSYYINKR